MLYVICFLSFALAIFSYIVIASNTSHEETKFMAFVSSIISIIIWILSSWMNNPVTGIIALVLGVILFIFTLVRLINDQL